MSESSDDKLSVNGEEQIANDRETNVIDDLTQTSVTDTHSINSVSSADVKLRPGQRVTFTNRDNGVQHTARV